MHPMAGGKLRTIVGLAVTGAVAAALIKRLREEVLEGIGQSGADRRAR